MLRAIDHKPLKDKERKENDKKKKKKDKERNKTKENYEGNEKRKILMKEYNDC